MSHQPNLGVMVTKSMLLNRFRWPTTFFLYPARSTPIALAFAREHDRLRFPAPHRGQVHLPQRRNAHALSPPNYRPTGYKSAVHFTAGKTRAETALALLRKHNV